MACMHPYDYALDKQSYFVHISNTEAKARLGLREVGEFLVSKDHGGTGGAFYLFVKVAHRDVRTVNIGPGPYKYWVNYGHEDEGPQCDIQYQPMEFDDICELIRYYQEHEFTVTDCNGRNSQVKLLHESVLENKPYFEHGTTVGDRLRGLSRGEFVIVRPPLTDLVSVYLLFVSLGGQRPRKLRIGRLQDGNYWLACKEEQDNLIKGRDQRSFEFILDLINYYHRNRFTDETPGLPKESLKLWTDDGTGGNPNNCCSVQ